MILCFYSLFDRALPHSAGPHPRLWFGERGSVPPAAKTLFTKRVLDSQKPSMHFIVCVYSLFDGNLPPSAGPHPRLWFGERGNGENIRFVLQFSRRENISPAGRISLSRSKNFTCRRHISHAAGVFHCDVACNITRGAPSPLVIWGTGERGNGGSVPPGVPPASKTFNKNLQ